MINFYNSWKKNNIKFSKYSIFLEHNIINKNKEKFLREYKYFYVYSNKHKKPIICEYAIWIDE